MLPSLDPAAALVVAHPGHELRVHHWLELTRPFVIVLTDGSGHSGQSDGALAACPSPKLRPVNEWLICWL